MSAAQRKLATATADEKSLDTQPVKLGKKMEWSSQRQQLVCACLVVIGAVALVAGLHYGKPILFPMTLAWLLSLLLSPVVRWTRRLGIPNALAAFFLVIGLLGSIVFLGQFLAEPASDWLEKLPQKAELIKSKLTLVQEPLANLKRAGEQVAELAQGSENSQIVVSVQDASWMQSLITDDLPAFSVTLMIVVVLMFFLLSSRKSMSRQLAHFGDTWYRRRQLMRVSAKIRQQLSTYLGTIAAVNFVLALATCWFLWLIDFPNPLLWGVVAGLLNFAPYVGPLIVIGVLALVGLSSFDSLLMAMAAPAGFLVLTTLEGQLITPSVVGYRLSLSPTLVFLAVVFWTWLWGVGGALMAAPLFACIKIACENWHTKPRQHLAAHKDR